MGFTDGITGTLQDIRDYFLQWHTNNYETLHRKTNQVSNGNNDPVTSNAVYNAINNLNANNIKEHSASTRYPNTIQTTLNDFDNRITQNTNKINNIPLASFGTLPNVLENVQKYSDKRDPESPSGFSFPNLCPQDAKNGLMTAEDKVDLYYYGEWYELNGTQAGFTGQYTNYFQMWVNLGLRMVYFRFYYVKCPWLKNSKEYIGPGDVFWKTNSVISCVLPIWDIWGATNVPGVYIGMSRFGDFYVRSTEKLDKEATINGSMMWFYRDAKVSRHLGEINEYACSNN